MTDHEQQPDTTDDDTSPATAPAPGVRIQEVSKKVREIGGRDGPDPTRYGDWEKNGRCIDF